MRASSRARIGDTTSPGPTKMTVNHNGSTVSEAQSDPFGMTYIQAEDPAS